MTFDEEIIYCGCGHPATHIVSFEFKDLTIRSKRCTRHAEEYCKNKYFTIKKMEL